jgi:hypothetical protein
VFGIQHFMYHCWHYELNAPQRAGYSSSGLLLIAPAPPPEGPPTCFLCNGPSSEYTTRRSNRNGNAGRPYYKCDPCEKFLTFADDRGNDPLNPLCHCQVSSRRQVSCREKGGKIHYVCRLGRCDFYEAGENLRGQVILSPDEEQIMLLLARLRLI